MENNNESIIKKKLGRPRTIEGETISDRNKVTMKKLSDTGYFKEYYNNRLKDVFCDCCRQTIKTTNILQHQKNKSCMREKRYLDLKEAIQSIVIGI